MCQLIYHEKNVIVLRLLKNQQKLFCTDPPGHGTYIERT